MSDVSVIGLGAMGSALATALLKGGFEVTVWNRTAAKAASLEQQGAHPAMAPAVAVKASPVTFVCVDDYAATREVLDTTDVTATLGERTIVQFSTGTPEEARDGEGWAKRHGAEWLGGAILAYPREIGDAALVFMSGDPALFGRHRSLLSALTSELRYLGAAIGAASALDLAVLSYYIGSHLGLVHGALVCESEQVGADTLTSVIVDSLPSDVIEIAHLGDALARNDFSEPGASLAVYSGILDRLLAQARSAGVNPEIPEFADRLVKRGMAAGLASEEMVSIVKVLRRKR